MVVQGGDAAAQLETVQEQRERLLAARDELHSSIQGDHLQLQARCRPQQPPFAFAENGTQR